MPSRVIKAMPPPQDVMRRYGKVRTRSKTPAPMAMVLLAACAMLGLVMISVGSGMATDLLGGIAAAFGNSLTKLTSQAPATVPPSGVTLTTPVLDVPPNGGYTNQAAVPIQGSVPSESVGKSGYSIHVYIVGKNGAQRQVATVKVGGTTRFITPPLTLTEGKNSFVATLVAPSGEGAPSPVVTYILDTTLPNISISSPGNGANVTTSAVDVSGTTDPGITVSIRNEESPGGGLNSEVLGADGKFKLTVPVVAGPNTIDLTATDLAGNVNTKGITVNRNYGQLAAHLSATPSKFKASSQTTVTLTLHVTSFNGGPLANAKVTFTMAVQGLAPIVSSELTTDATGTATWQVPVVGATHGTGQASVLVTSPGGDVVMATTTITTT